MAETEFEILAAKVLADEGSENERRRLEELLAQDSDLRAEFAELELARSCVREVGPLAQALEAAPVPIPEHRLRELQAVVRDKFGGETRTQSVREVTVELVLRWSWGYRAAFTGVALIALTVGLLLFFRWPHKNGHSGSNALAYMFSVQGGAEIRREGQLLAFAPFLPVRPDDEIRLATGNSVSLLTDYGVFQVTGPKKFTLESVNTNDPAFTLTRALAQVSGVTNGLAAKTLAALFQPRKQLLAMSLLVTKRDVGNIPIYAPVGSTRSLAPVIVWKSEPGKLYNLSLKDEFNPNSRTVEFSGVMSPVEFSKIKDWKERSLAKDGLYRLRITERGNSLSATESTFRTLNDAAMPEGAAPTPLENLDQAWQSLLSPSPSIGDTLTELLMLPSELAESELALRLKLVAFGQLGFKEEYDATATQLGLR